MKINIVTDETFARMGNDFDSVFKMGLTFATITQHETGVIIPGFTLVEDGKDNFYTSCTAAGTALEEILGEEK